MGGGDFFIAFEEYTPLLKCFVKLYTVTSYTNYVTVKQFHVATKTNRVDKQFHFATKTNRVDKCSRCMIFVDTLIFKPRPILLS